MPVAILIFLILAAAIIVGAIYLRRRKERVAVPSCAACGYDVRLLQTFICPECGSDLREVGIVTPETSIGIGRRGWLALWTVIIVLLAPFVLAFFFWIMVPYAVERREWVSFDGPHSGAFERVRVERIHRSTHWYGPDRSAIAMQHSPATWNSIEIEIRPQRGGDSLTLRREGEYHFRDEQGQVLAGRETDDAAAIVKWAKAVGIVAGDNDALHELQQLGSAIRKPSAAMVSDIVPHSFSTHSGTMSSGSANPHSGFASVAFAMYLGIWLVGCAVIWRKHRPVEPRLSMG